MLSTKNWIYLGLVVAAFAVFIPRSVAQTISCSSDDGKRHYCSANGHGTNSAGTAAQRIRLYGRIQLGIG